MTSTSTRNLQGAHKDLTTKPQLLPPNSSTTATTTARNHYDSTDADTFYHTTWGGSDIHLRLYTTPTTTMTTASNKFITRTASLLGPLSPTTHILDMGAGYGGAARHLAKTNGCKVTWLNLSVVENERNRAMTKDAGLEHPVDVVKGSIEDVPVGAHTVGVAWSQDAFLHLGKRKNVIGQIERVGEEGGTGDFERSDGC